MSKRFPLGVGGRTVAEYVLDGPRPHLHPVRTLAGTVVTDVEPADHPHHLGVSVAMQDVNGTNLWGGRTYVRGEGYQWRDDHGRIEHLEWRERTGDRLAHALAWRAKDGAVLLHEERTITAAPEGAAWRLAFEYTLTNPGAGDVTLGSPATNGRPGKSGYGGFFWRLPISEKPPRVYTQDADAEEDVNGSAAPWVAIGTDEFTLRFGGLGDGDRWFVRAAEYPGVCVALAFTEARRIPPGGNLSRRHDVTISDGWVPADP